MQFKWEMVFTFVSKQISLRSQAVHISLMHYISFNNASNRQIMKSSYKNIEESGFFIQWIIQFLKRAVRCYLTRPLPFSSFFSSPSLVRGACLLVFLLPILCLTVVYRYFLSAKHQWYKKSTLITVYQCLLTWLPVNVWHENRTIIQSTMQLPMLRCTLGQITLLNALWFCFWVVVYWNTLVVFR